MRSALYNQVQGGDEIVGLLIRFSPRGGVFPPSFLRSPFLASPGPYSTRYFLLCAPTSLPHSHRQKQDAIFEGLPSIFSWILDTKLVQHVTLFCKKPPPCSLKKNNRFLTKNKEQHLWISFRCMNKYKKYKKCIKVHRHSVNLFIHLIYLVLYCNIYIVEKYRKYYPIHDKKGSLIIPFMNILTCI